VLWESSYHKYESAEQSRFYLDKGLAATRSVHYMCKFLPLICVTLLLACCTGAVKVAELDKQGLTAQEYEVYSAALNAIYAGSKEFDVLVVEDRTLSISHTEEEWTREMKSLLRHMPGISQEMIDDFHSKNRGISSLTKSVNLPIKCVLIDAEESRKVFQGNISWSDFYFKYPKAQGLMALSRVGFNASEEQALIYIRNQRSYNIGEGFYVLLFKENHTWIIKEKYQSLIS